MDHPIKAHHKSSQKLFSSNSKYVHGGKHLIKQEKNRMSDCSGSTSSSDKYGYSKLYMNKNSNVNTDTEIKGRESIDYDVIKQFDELISELSKSEEHEEKFSDSYDLCDIVQENMKNDTKSFNEKVLCSENYRDPSMSELKDFGKGIDPKELNSMNYLLKDQHKFDFNSIPDKKQNENSLSEIEGNISWIDSNLWSVKNENQSYQFQKHVSQINKNIDLGVLASSCKRVHSNITQPVAGCFGRKDILNPSAFHIMQTSKIKDVKYSGYTGIMKNDHKMFPHSDAYFKEMNVCKSNYRPVKISGTVSLQNSPRTSRSPASKYVLPNNCFVVKLFVETRDLHLGPFPFEIYLKMSLRLLKLKVEQEHGIISSSQRWILGKCFAVDNDKSLVDYNVMPGSSIILYVDNNQRICYDASKNQFVGVKNITSINYKMVDDNTVEESKELSDVLENIHSKAEQIEASEVLMTNSCDSIPVHSCSKNDHGCCIKSQNSENISLLKEQCINSASGGETYDKTKSPVIKKKGLKKSIELKKKTKIIVPVLSDTPRDNYDEKSHFDKPESYIKSHDIFCKEKKPITVNLLNSVETEVNENKPNQSQEASLDDVLITFQTNNSGILNEHTQSSSFTETVMSLNSSLTSPVKDFTLTETSKHFPSRYIVGDNLLGSSCFTNSSRDLIKNSWEFKNRNEDTDNKDSLFNVAETNSHSRDELLPEEPENLNLSDINISTGKEIIKTLDNKTEGKFSFDDSSKNEEKNSVDLSATISEKPDTENGLPAKNLETLNINSFGISAGMSYKLDTENVPSTKNSEDPVSSNISRVEEVKKAENSHNKIECNILKPKRSVSSLIRKLSLTCKGKSLDDSSSLDNTSSDKFQNERTEEKTSKQTTLISNQLQYSDVHIEISPQVPDFLPAKDEASEQCENELPEEDHTIHNPESVKNFELLLEIENMDLVENPTNFTCPVCFDEFESGQGIILHDCLHVFCRICLTSAINYADGALVKCPYRDDFYSCQSHLQQREIKALVPEDVYEKYLQRSIITAEGSEERSFHCKTLDCPGWCIYDNAINVFHCPVCFHYNCLNCQAIHEGLNCRQYQDKLKLQQKIDQDAQKTLELLNKMIEAGKALRCPKCDLILMKKWGCDWLKCSICQTEICWITKGPRWGPGGQGDTSGGCRCGVNGVKCHPSCTYCH